MKASADKLSTTMPTEDGRHPKHQHLIYAEFDPHCGSFIVKSPVAPDMDTMLVSEDDARPMLGDQFDEDDASSFGYISDEYLECFQAPA